MDCYDEILKISQDENDINKYIQYLTDLINKKSKYLTELEFKNCLILTLAVWNPKFIDRYFSKGKSVNNLNKNKKDMVIKLLELEFRNLKS
ncbi:MAG: hypothetical protein ACFFDF_25355 [Candidatus Odinarchaeota archaeon]